MSVGARAESRAVALALAAVVSLAAGFAPAGAARTLDWTASPSVLARGETAGVAVSTGGRLFLAVAIRFVLGPSSALPYSVHTNIDKALEALRNAR